MHARLRRPAALAAAAAVAVGATAIPAASGAASSGSAADLRRHQAELERQSTSALLELYAHETQLAGARAAAAEALRRQQELDAARVRVEKRLDRARRDAQTAEAALAERLRTLYATSDVHPVAVVLGATSLDDALTGLDGLRFVAEADSRIVAQTRRARDALQAARRDLEERRAAAAAAAATAVARAAEAERAHAEATALLDRLAAERRLTDARIAQLERQARAARAQAEALTAAPTTGATTAASAPAPADAPPPAAPLQAPQLGPGGSLTVVATGYALPGRTATGIPVGPGVVAVDPSVIPLGTRISIPGYGEGIAADVGGSVKGNTIDLWFPTRAQALRWGRRTITITVR